MEAKENSNNLMGDVVVVSPLPSPLQQQNYGSLGSNSPNDKTIKIPNITITQQEQDSESNQQNTLDEESEEEQVPDQRRKSFRKRKKSGHGGGVDPRYIPPYKLRRMIRRHTSCPSGSGPLSKSSLRFLLGGNAHDPLNLNGLGDSDNISPKTSPLPQQSKNSNQQRVTSIPILIPKDYGDPLRLMDEDVENTRDVIAGVVPSHRRRRHRKRSLRKRNESECSVESASAQSEDADGKSAEIEAAEVIAQNNITELRDEEDEPSTDPAEDARKSQNSEAQVENNGKEEAAEKEEKPKSSSPKNVENQVVNGDANDKDPAAKSDFPFRVSSEYIPLSSHYQPSPFVMDTVNENFTILPFESPSMSNYTSTQETFTITEPFSPPQPHPHFDVIIEHRVPSGHYGLGWTPPRSEAQIVPRRQIQDQLLNAQQTMFNRRHRHRLDPIVSPVFPNFGCKRSNHHSHSRHKKHPHEEKEESKELKTADEKPKDEQGKKKYKPKDKLFRFGNYNQYYGYRNPGLEEDARLRAMKKEWMEGKDILDIGCNIGHITFCIGRDLGPRRVVGVDIDPYLIGIARKNMKHYVNRDPTDVSIKFPSSLSRIHGTIQPPQLPVTQGVGGTMTTTEKKGVPFPYNVSFKQENYVLDNDDLLSGVKPEFDVIVCLSTTKWVHLNFGDEGLKRFFRRAFLHLRPGGLFILEPQAWSSYKKKKKITEQIHETFKKIQLFPKDFEKYLLKEVGFNSVSLVGIPAHHSKGFQRPIYIYTKSKPAETVTKEENIEITEEPSQSQP